MVCLIVQMTLGHLYPLCPCHFWEFTIEPVLDVIKVLHGLHFSCFDSLALSLNSGFVTSDFTSVDMFDLLHLGITFDLFLTYLVCFLTNLPYHILPQFLKDYPVLNFHFIKTWVKLCTWVGKVGQMRREIERESKWENIPKEVWSKLKGASQSDMGQ